MSYEAIIGLEIHSELATSTKLFCGCKNEFGGAPNTRICPVCTGQPGTLPSTNRKAVELALRACAAFSCEINRKSPQCRKHYFYPDLPKGYQISQRSTPLGVNGKFKFVSGGEEKEIGIRQIHIEEDAGKLVHFPNGQTGIDYNRAGVPLIEIVTKPELKSASDARAFLEAVRRCLIRCGVSDCRMEQGSLRCDVNVSLRKAEEQELSARVEMKNINTFSGVLRAIEYEIERQNEIVSNGGTISQETRKWDDEKRESRIMRTKENAIDYKFMPEPDIPPYEISSEDIKAARKELPESDVSRLRRYKQLGVSDNDCACIISDIGMADFFDKIIEKSENSDECAKLLVGDIAAILSKENISFDEIKLTPEGLVSVAGLIKDGKITRQSAKRILQELMLKGGSASEAAKEYMSITDEELIRETVLKVINANEKARQDYATGKASALTFLMGQCMREISGRAEAAKLNALLIKELKGEK